MSSFGRSVLANFGQSTSALLGALSTFRIAHAAVGTIRVDDAPHTFVDSLVARVFRVALRVDRARHAATTSGVADATGFLFASCRIRAGLGTTPNFGVTHLVHRALLVGTAFDTSTVQTGGLWVFAVFVRSALNTLGVDAEVPVGRTHRDVATAGRHHVRLFLRKQLECSPITTPTNARSEQAPNDGREPHDDGFARFDVTASTVEPLQRQTRAGRRASTLARSDGLARFARANATTGSARP